MSKFIILCGGTGGHLAPGLAVGQSLIKAGHQASFVISKKQVDARLVKKYTDLDIIKAPGVALSKNPIAFFKFVMNLCHSFFYGRKILKRGKYDALISFGGFNSLGFSLAAAQLNIPIVLHEANRKAGKATKLLGRFAKRIYVPYGVKIPRRKAGQVKYAGYPIRDEIQKNSSESSKELFGFNKDEKLIVLLGGSQGAEALNNWVDNKFENIANVNTNVLCVCGQGKVKYENREILGADNKPKSIKFLEFCDNMAGAMSAADVVIARAGAGTIAELARCKVPSAIIPYPFAADNHQLENGRCFERQGACVVVEQKNLHLLFEEIKELLDNQNLRKTIIKNLERVDDLNDTKKIITDLEHIARGESD